MKMIFFFYKINYIIYAEHMQSVILMCQIPISVIKSRPGNPGLPPFIE